MTEQKDKKSLDELISHTIDGEILKFDFNTWKENHQQDIQEFKTRMKDRIIETPVPTDLWRTIPKSPITKLAAAAVIIIAVMTCVNHFVGPTEGMVWADVVKNLEAAKTCVYRIRCSSEGVLPGASIQPRKTGTWVVYNSSKYGIRMDAYSKGYLEVTTYYPPDMSMVTYVFHPPHKQYRRQHLDQQQRRFAREHLKDPRDILKDFMAFEHKKLGLRDINDVRAEGIEINDPRLLKARYPEGGGLESYVMRLWVDVKTNLPVRVETNCTYEGGSYRTAWTTDRLEWNVDLEASIFEPNIPADYTPQKHGYYYRGG